MQLDYRGVCYLAGPSLADSLFVNLQEGALQEETTEEEDMDRSSEERLLAFDSFASDVREELAATTSRMESLRAEGKTKTATYQQLFAIRSTLREIDARLADHGL